MQNHQADSPLYVWPDVWSADLHLFIKNMVMHDIEYPYWDQMSLNNANQTKPMIMYKLVFKTQICISFDYFQFGAFKFLLKAKNVSLAAMCIAVVFDGVME